MFEIMNTGLHFTKPTKVLKKPEINQINKSYECFIVDQSSSYIILKQKLPSRGSLFGITRLLRPEGHHLASRGCAEWCKTVIPRDGIFYPHRTLMPCIHFDSACFIVKVAFITTQNDVGIGHFLKLTSLHYGVLYNQCKPNPRDNFLFLSMGEITWVR